MPNWLWKGYKIPDGKYKGIVAGPEYEAGWSFGASSGINDMNAIDKANHVCNLLGMDPITMGSTIACAMELYEKELLLKRFRW